MHNILMLTDLQGGLTRDTQVSSLSLHLKTSQQTYGGNKNKYEANSIQARNCALVMIGWESKRKNKNGAAYSSKASKPLAQ